MKSCFFLILFILSSNVFAERKLDEQKLYVGVNSTEAVIEYQTTVQKKWNRTTNPSAKWVKELVDSQVEHMVGPMSMGDVLAVPKGDHVLSEIKLDKIENGFAVVSYKFKGTAVVGNGPREKLDIVLPIAPDTIYESSFVGDKNPCTDDHYQSEGDFWYFWSPEREGCNLKENVDYKIVKAKLTRIANTKKSYPEYSKLPDANGVVSMHVFFGLDDSSKSRDASTSKDINADNYREFRAYLLGHGYTSRKMTETEVKRIAKTSDGKLPYVEVFSKDKMQVRLFFGATGINEDSKAFHWFFKDAIENASIMIYNGHSGLGGHLDLASIEANIETNINFNTNRYQIFFFDSCTSYRYYNQQYLERKMTEQDPKGTKKLDIFTNGLSTYFHVLTNANVVMTEAVEKALQMSANGQYVSYQTIAQEIDSDNLFGIVGDEDNELPR